ncbi:MAG: DUF427 domain-containing protein [Bacteroidota bacterium]
MKGNRIKPKEGQESVWDYPRPPRLERSTKHIRIVYNDQVIADSNQNFRVLETSHPPTYYLPVAACASGVLQPVAGNSFCEFKGMAHYYDIQVGERIAKRCAWGYKDPSRGFEELANTVCVYAHLMDSCFVNDEKVQPQEGDFYGGWITKEVVGPFKGAPGTWGW